ncbi:DNA-binding response regulator (plasmid) [Erwinia billingiae]|uniref:response regulator transcription factor n=1 Tax=Erwinia billingiae TaxID=182337 RepID=UPI0012448A4B|nr:LuxR C-terminal-related transcriptional regulator [Erwinia billingiae]QEW34507.1 DNA-binding response regulator [Erwinia billingiae]
MFTLAVLDSDAFCSKGVADYFNARDIRTFCCPDVAELEDTLGIHSVQVVIAELATSKDTTFSCIKCLTQLTLRWPHIRLVIFTHITDPVLMKYVLQHIKHCNVVVKSDSVQQLASCVFAGAGGHSFNSSPQAKVWKYIQDDRKTLTPLEFRLLEMLARGKTNKLIAPIVSRSSKTISCHKKNIMKKLGCRNITELHSRLFELDMLQKN